MANDQTWERLCGDRRITVGSGASEMAIAESERDLGLRFPADYREFLRRVGWARIKTERLYGLGCLSNASPDVATATLAARAAEEIEWPRTAIAIMGFGNGDIYYLETSEMRDEQCPVYLWDHELLESDEVGQSFVQWIVRILDDPQLSLPLPW